MATIADLLDQIAGIRNQIRTIETNAVMLTDSIANAQTELNADEVNKSSLLQQLESLQLDLYTQLKDVYDQPVPPAETGSPVETGSPTEPAGSPVEPPAESGSPVVVPPPPPPPVQDVLDDIGTKTYPGGATLHTNSGDWSVTTSEQIVRNGTVMENTGNVKSIEVVASYSNSEVTTVKQTASGSNWAYSWTYDPDWTGLGAQPDGWVRDDLAGTPVDPPAGSDVLVTDGWTNGMIPITSFPLLKSDASGELSTKANFSKGAGFVYSDTAANMTADGMVMSIKGGTSGINPEVKWEAEKKRAAAGLRPRGVWEAIVTLPSKWRNGVCMAPWWLYEHIDYSPTVKAYELDFEIVKDGLCQINYHYRAGWKTLDAVSIIPHLGHDVLFGIEKRSASIRFYIKDMTLNGVVVYDRTFTSVEMPMFPGMDIQFFPISESFLPVNPAWVGNRETTPDPFEYVVKSYRIEPLT